MIIGYIHICQQEGWKRSFQLIWSALKESGLYQATEVIRCGVALDSEVTLDLDLLTDPKIKIINISSANLWERPTLLSLREQSYIDDETTVYWYCHTKGLRHFGTEREPFVLDWIAFLIYWTLERWQEAVLVLKSYTTYGCNLEGCPYYSGNFWWATNAHIRSLPAVIPLDSYGAPEEWILLAEGNPFCIFNSGLQPDRHYTEPYPRSLYRENLIS